MVRTFGPASPRIENGAFVHDSAEIIGRVHIKKNASVWPLAVLRGDVDRVVIEERANVQDLCVIHCREKRPSIIGRGTTVGHRVIVHGARIGRRCLLGMGAVVMEAAIGDECLVGAGALVLAGMAAPARSLILGSPARVIRCLTAQELKSLKLSEDSYARLAERHAQGSRIVFPLEGAWN